jgi:hypothetical protein
MLKKMTALPYHTAPNPLTAEDITEITENLETVAAKCKTLDGVIRHLMDIEEREGSFTDPFHILARIDSICANYPEA